MPQLKSAEKRLRQSIERRRRNRATRSEIRTEMRRFLETLESGQIDPARDSLRKVFSLLDAAAAKGTVKKNFAARYKSRLSRRLARLEGKPPDES